MCSVELFLQEGASDLRMLTFLLQGRATLTEAKTVKRVKNVLGIVIPVYKALSLELKSHTALWKLLPSF